MKKITFTFVSALIMSVLGLQAQSWSSGTSSMYLNPTSTKLGIGTSSPNSMLHINSTTSTNTPFRVQVQSSSKLLVSPNGGVSIGSASAGPANGLYVAGKVGVGTTTPQAELSIAGSVYIPYLKSYWVGSASDSGNRLRVAHSGSNAYIDFEPDLIYRQGNLVEVMRLKSNGNVGIGIANPAAKLDVAGNMRLYVPYNGPVINAMNIDVQSFNTWENAENSSFLKMTDVGGNRTAFIVKGDGNVGINVANPTTKLDVAGTIRAHEVKVCLNQGCDYVFDKDYNLMSISDVSDYVKTNKHLPDVAPAAEMESEGINLSEMNALLLRKVEELTLYVIELNEKIEELEQK